MANLYRFGPKDPATATDPFTFDLSAWLVSEDTTYTIVGSVTADATPSGLTIGAIVYSGPLITVYLSGGTAGVDYTLYVHVSAQDQDGNVRGPVAIGAIVPCTTPVPAP